MFRDWLDSLPVFVLDVVDPELLVVIELRLRGAGKLSPIYPQLSSMLSQRHCLDQQRLINALTPVQFDKHLLSSILKTQEIKRAVKE